MERMMATQKTGSRRYRKGLAVALLVAGLGLPAAPAAAWCPSCVSVPLINAADTAIRIVAMAALKASTLMAIGLQGGGVSAAVEAQAAAQFDAAKSMAGWVNTSVMQASSRKTAVLSARNTQSTNCQLQFLNNVSTVLQTHFQNSVAYNLQDNVIDMFFNRGFTPERAQVAALQRNCKNGQFRREDMGQAWWDSMNAASPPSSQCFEDVAPDMNGDGYPDPEFGFAHAFMKPSTILSHRVLVPPSDADMAVMNNPDTGNPQAVWNGLNAKQRRFVSAVRFCENIALQAMKPMAVHGNAAFDPRNVTVIMDNLSAMGKLDALVYVCRSELARRTSPNNAVAYQASSATDRPDVERVASILLKSGAKLRPTGEADEFQERNASGAVVNYMSPALLAYSRAAYCNNNRTRMSFYGDQGSDAEKASNLMRCQQLKLLYNETEEVYRSMFNNMIAGVEGVRSQFATPLVAPVRRSDADGLVKQASFGPGDKIEAAPQQQLTLREMLQQMKQ